MSTFAEKLKQTGGIVLRISMIAGSLAALSIGCSEDREATCPPTQLVIVEGRAIAGGAPVARWPVELRAPQARGDRNGPRREVHALTDSTGWYMLEAPPGDYLLEFGYNVFFGREGLSSQPTDTLRLTTGRHRADFTFGSLRVEMPVPPWFGETGISLTAESIEPEVPFSFGASGVASDDHVSFLFRAVAPGMYRLSWWTDEQRTAVWAPGTLDLGQAVVIPVGAEEPTSYDAPPFPGWRLTGRIEGSWQAVRLSPPRVEAFLEDSTRIAESKTSADGSYAIVVPLVRSVRVHLSLGGMEQWLAGEDFSSAQAYSGSPGETVEAASYMESGIECRFESPMAPTRISPRVELRDADGRRVTPEHFSPERSNPLPIPNLAPGTYYLFVSPDNENQGWGPQWYDGADSLGSATPIIVGQEGSVTRITMHLKPRSAMPGGAI